MLASEVQPTLPAHGILHDHEESVPLTSSAAVAGKTITVRVKQITGARFMVVGGAATIGDQQAAIEQHGGPAPDAQKLVLDTTQAPLPEDARADAARCRRGRRLRSASWRDGVAGVAWRAAREAAVLEAADRVELAELEQIVCCEYGFGYLCCCCELTTVPELTRGSATTLCRAELLRANPVGELRAPQREFLAAENRVAAKGRACCVLSWSVFVAVVLLIVYLTAVADVIACFIGPRAERKS